MKSRIYVSHAASLEPSVKVQGGGLVTASMRCLEANEEIDGIEEADGGLAELLTAVNVLVLWCWQRSDGFVVVTSHLDKGESGAGNSPLIEQT